MDEEEKRSLLCPCQESNTCHPAPSLITILTELPWLFTKWAQHISGKLLALFSLAE
jgi:hypothetical protein